MGKRTLSEAFGLRHGDSRIYVDTEGLIDGQLPPNAIVLKRRGRLQHFIRQHGWLELGQVDTI
jgi:hypothetical protein